MAGTKEKSGGARIGAGRPRREPEFINVLATSNPVAFLTSVMNSSDTDTRLRVDAAKALMPYLYAKKREGGKKEEQANAAKKASTGRFGLRPPPPKLVR